MYTKAWKVLTPSISKKEPSVYWNWSNDQDGVRIFEVFCADLTGHPSYIIVRITRNTEEECNEEWAGQITDGYFENYRGDIRGKEVDPAKIKLDMSRIEDMCTEVRTRTIPDIRWDLAHSHKYINDRVQDSAAVILTYFGIQDVRASLRTDRREYEAARVKAYGWNGEETPENLKKLTAAEEKYVKSLSDAWATIRQHLENERKAPAGGSK